LFISRQQAVGNVAGWRFGLLAEVLKAESYLC